MILVNHMNQEIIVALPQNDPELVEKLISMLGWDPQISGAN